MKRTFIIILTAMILLPIAGIRQTVAPIMPISNFANYPPQTDGITSEGEWASTYRMSLPHGSLHIQHDAANLYLLLDLTADTQEDAPLTQSPWGDYCSIFFDVDTDSSMTMGVDLLLGFYPGSYEVGKQIYAGGGGWGGAQPAASRLGAGFRPSINNATAHRIWEYAIALSEIEAVPGSIVRFGLNTHSQNPDFDDKVPADVYSSFTNLVEITLAQKTVDLLVLTHESFMEAVKPLKAHKDYTGIATYVQSWQDLNKSFVFEGRDEPERIKKAIAQYDRYCNARWVMLIGDSDLFPVRYTMTDRGTQAAYNRAFYSADLYYACLYKPQSYTFDDWDANQNGYYGELHGETIPGTVNVDQADLDPDIAVGRIPATTATQVTTYLNKVINYEFAAYKQPWAKRALMIATTDWISDAYLTKENITTYLSGYDIYKIYQAWTGTTPTAADINSNINLGIGLVNYIGHGGASGWAPASGPFLYSIADSAGLSNTDKHPITFSAGCDTAGFMTEPPYEPYTDTYGNHHIGTDSGEVFSNEPPQPAGLQTIDNPYCFGEHMLLNASTGFIGYIGCTTGSQGWGIDLDNFFFQSIDYGWDTLGEMWNFAIRKYYQKNPIPSTIDPPDWFKVAMVHQPWKFHLFGDPSLRINGIPYFQKQDFAGTYELNHDDWEGILRLWPTGDNYIEQMPNMLGTYTSPNGQQHNVRGYVRTWQYPLPESWGPDHKIEFYIDFYDTPSTSDDQKFEGYLYTHTKNCIAGVTWWGGTPFGFYATRLPGLFKATTLYAHIGGAYYPLETISNSTVELLSVSQPAAKLTFSVTGPTGTTGILNITIPKTLLWGDFTIYMDTLPLTEGEHYIHESNSTHNTFSLNYAHSTHTIEIKGTQIVPELQPLLFLTLIAPLTVLAVAFKRRQQKQD
jgi:hypothetical protein